MNKETKLAEEKQKRFREAKKNLQKMQEEIAPFIKLRKFKKYSTEGEWRETSSLRRLHRFRLSIYLHLLLSIDAPMVSSRAHVTRIVRTMTTPMRFLVLHPASRFNPSNA